MAEPKYARKVGGGRRYIWPPSGPPYELDVPSATTILGAGLPKPALVGWAAREAAEYAVDCYTLWANLPRDAAVDQIKKTATRKRDKKAEMGTITHEAIECFVGGEHPSVRLDVLGYYNAALAFLNDHVEEIGASELTVYSRTHGYAGTTDLLARVKGFEGTTICDFKTGKDVWDDAFIQIAAYAKADFFADGEVEVLMPEVRTGIVVNLKDDGSYKAVPCTDLDERFAMFLAAKAIYEGNKDFRQAAPL